jgi:hypothetical protein
LVEVPGEFELVLALLPNGVEVLFDPDDPKVLFAAGPNPLFVPGLSPLFALVPIVDGPRPGPDGLRPPVVTTF